jgi:hypothetical protein
MEIDDQIAGKDGSLDWEANGADIVEELAKLRLAVWWEVGGSFPSPTGIKGRCKQGAGPYVVGGGHPQPPSRRRRWRQSQLVADKA